MKKQRQQSIKALIEQKKIDTQEKLKDELEAMGFSVTQATVSRDINEMGLVKALCPDGGYRYSIGAKTVLAPVDELHNLMHTLAAGVDFAGNTVVIRCHTGMAQAVCAKLDAAGFSQVVGTLAGDDTIFVLMRSQEDAAELSAVLAEDIIERHG